MIIRETTGKDLTEMLHVSKQAFGQREGDEVAGLVKNLLADTSAKPLLSLIAIDDGKAIGHVLFTKARVEGADDSVSAVILAPLAVVPEKQSQGVGGLLVKEGLHLLSESNIELVFVLGHPEYYPRHGFKPAGTLGFEACYQIPEENAGAWMVQELIPGVISRIAGKVLCAEALDRPEYWRE